MGLDKKPTPPPKRFRENRPRDVISPKDSPEVKVEMTGEDEASRSENESGQPQEAEPPVREETAAEEDKVRQGIDTVTVFVHTDLTVENISNQAPVLGAEVAVSVTSRDSRGAKYCMSSSADYEEDFEADDEGPADDAEEKEKKSLSPFGESQGQVKEGDSSETEDDEKEGRSRLLFVYSFQEQHEWEMIMLSC